MQLAVQTGGWGTRGEWMFTLLAQGPCTGPAVTMLTSVIVMSVWQCINILTKTVVEVSMLSTKILTYYPIKTRPQQLEKTCRCHHCAKFSKHTNPHLTHPVSSVFRTHTVQSCVAGVLLMWFIHQSCTRSDFSRSTWDRSQYVTQNNPEYSD